MGCKMTAKDNDSVLVLHSPSPLKSKNHQILPFCQSAQELYISLSQASVLRVWVRV